jgi:thiol-disulfide isomerase/thioredoxin
VNDPAGPAAPAKRAGVLLGMGLLALCAIAGFLLYRATRPVSPTLFQQPPAVSLQGAPESPPSPESSAQPVRMIPDNLPAITLPDAAGTPRSLRDFRGRLLVVNFWATWCEPCRREIPLLQSVRDKYAKNGVEVVGIALDHRDDVAKYAAEMHIRYPLLIGEKGGLDAVNALGMDTVLPFSVFADRDGRIVTLKIGELHPEEATLILGSLVDLDQKHLTLDGTRERISAGMARLRALSNATGAPASN